jgi:hypothetical protein
VTIYPDFPDLAVLRKLERDTLRRVTEISEFARLSELRAAAGAAAASINELRGAIDVNLGFTLEIRLRGDRKGKPTPRRVDVGARVEPTPDNKAVRSASYSLLICRRAEPQNSPIVRKVHFDYEPSAFRNPADPKPSAHMQICGEFSPHHLKAGYDEVRLRAMYPGWEKPRIPLPPTSLALLLNWLLLEFQSDPASQGILNSPAWRTWVAKAERTVLGPYFTSATNFLASTADSKRRFLQTHLYSMTVD